MSKIILPLILASFFLSACSLPGVNNSKTTEFASDDQENTKVTPTPLADPLSIAKIETSQSRKLNEEFNIIYKTYDPDGEGSALFKARSFKPIDSIDGVVADEGKKLYLLEITVKGSAKNKGNPATFNQIGDTPSPQFVLIDKANNLSYVEETYFSDSYTVWKDLFELSKITLDGDQTVNTAIVFQIDQKLEPDLAFRFTNISGQTEFYDIAE